MFPKDMTLTIRFTLDGVPWEMLAGALLLGLLFVGLSLLASGRRRAP